MEKNYRESILREFTETDRFWLQYDISSHHVATSKSFPVFEEKINQLAYQFVMNENASNLRNIMRYKNTVHIGFHENDILIITDFYGQQPIYIYEWENTLFIFSHFNDLFNQLRNPHLTVDEVGIWETFIFDSSLCARTIYKEVSMLPPGTVTIFPCQESDSKSLRYYNYQFPPQKVQDIREAAQEKLRILRATALNVDANSFLIPLSGGIDSRLITSVFQDVWGSDKIKAISFAGSKSSYEIKYAKQVCSLLGIQKWSYYLLTANSYIRSLDILTHRFGGNLSISHGHLNDFLVSNQNLLSDNTLLISGAFADAVSGYAVHGAPQNISLDSSSTIERLNSINQSLLLGHIYNDIYRDIESIYNSYASGTSIETFDEYFYISQRQHRVQLLQSALYGDTLRVNNPYANPDLAEYLLGLPWEIRKDKAITREALSLQGKNINSIPDVSSSKNRKTLVDKSRLFRSKIANNLSRTLTLLFRDQHLFFSPFETESQDFNLRTSHRSLALDAMQDLEEKGIINQMQRSILSRKPTKQYGGWFLTCTQYWSMTIARTLKNHSNSKH